MRFGWLIGGVLLLGIVAGCQRPAPPADPETPWTPPADRNDGKAAWRDGATLPAEIDLLTRPLIVGLTKDPDRLVQIRRNRLKLLNQGETSSYADPEIVRNEVTEARRLFSRRKWPVIDVSRRSIEETASEIMMLLARRQSSGLLPDGSKPDGTKPDGTLP